MDFRVSIIALMVGTPLGLSCMTTDPELDEASPADSDATVPVRIREKIGEIPLYRWTYFALVEQNHRRDVYDLGAWWLAHVQPNVRLAPQEAGGVMYYHEATFGEDPTTTNHYTTYSVPPDNLLTSPEYQIEDADGVVHASGGSEIVCDGQFHRTPVISTPEVYVSLYYACTTLPDTGVVGYCRDCGQLETSASMCDQLYFFWSSP